MDYFKTLDSQNFSKNLITEGTEEEQPEDTNEY